ncbi:hypothetical protein [Helicobacter fennelliae]|uniref:Uncharacterized protein n=2 Tax=Helicobacter fennelliae TaxID=215 RepID=T1D266_9HELI|nr:hypothetical protein [Helicobacter fennelliae]GAD19316.1 hypothetical protein HFN_0447 [Helicobacter fennelliae MRY12-0050]SQB99090.1 Uncharacterised protein [Helicobacter fennelliae]STP08367.1 Uncharacterised protein [Helicobacter fennelliae]STQ84780.1 Uncharacterised protein [Helicobacter fennelliae]
MEKCSFFVLSLEFDMQHLKPFEIYESLGIRPCECKIGEHAAIMLEYKIGVRLWRITKNPQLATL